MMLAAKPVADGRPARSAANALVAERFRRLADLLEIEGANPYRVRAYRRAAGTVETLRQDVATLPLPALDALPGLGPDLAGKVTEICRTGRLAALDATEAQLPATLVGLADLPGLGPKRIHRLYWSLGVRGAADLRAAAAAGAVRGLPGFGPAMERRLLEALTGADPASGRWALATARPQAAALEAALRSMPEVSAASVAGSIRRGRPTVGDIDLVAAARDGAQVTRAFTDLPQVDRTIARGRSRATVVLKSGLQADLLVVPSESFGAALIHFTGSKTHNIALRRRAKARGLKLNERGLYQADRRLAGRTEAEVYEALGLAEIPPGQRERPVED